MVSDRSIARTEHRGWRRHAPTLLVALLTLGIQLPFLDRFVSFMDEGHLLQYADLLAGGGEVYRDATIYPLPGAFYLLSFAFQIFEPSILLARWIVALEFSFFCALLFSLLRRLSSTRTAALGLLVLLLYRIWVFPHWHIYSYSTTALLLLLLTLVTLVRFFDHRGRGTLALAGFLYGLAVLCKQDYGAAGLLAFCAVLVVEARSRPGGRVLATLSGFLLPAAAVGGLTGLHYLRVGLLGEVIQQTVLNHFVGMASFEYSALPGLFPILSQDPTLRDPAGVFDYWPGILLTVDYFHAVRTSWLYRETAILDGLVKAFYYLPYPLIVAGGFRLLRRRAELAGDRRVPFLAELTLYALAAALLALFSLNRPQDYVHLAVLYWSLLCLALVYLHDLFRPHPRLAMLLLALLLIPGALATAYSAELAWQLRSAHSEKVPGPRAGVRARPEEARALASAVEYVRAQTAPEEAVTVLPYHPLVHFLAERRAPHGSSYIVWPFPEYPDRERRIIDAMEEQDTRVVIYAFTAFPSYPPPEEYAPELFAYLVEHFEIDRLFDHGLLGYRLAALRREPELPPGRRLLPERPSGELWWERARGVRTAIPMVQREDFVARELWPFRPVLALRPSADGWTVLSVPLRVPRDARLRTAVGVHPRAWHSHPATWTRFRLELVSGRGRELLFERTLDPGRRLADRGWFEVEVPLDAWTGESVALEFSTSSEHIGGEDLLHGGWAEPRLTPLAPAQGAGEGRTPLEARSGAVAD
ncbi:MAG: glycosyltransferase family 39 protein [Myxococcota bacterium]